MKKISKYNIALTVGLSLSAGATVAQKSNQPNIIFILLDDMGKEWIEKYGAPIKTPNLNAFAENGIEFSRAYSMPQSTPSRIALLTGQYPYVNGWVDHYDAPRWGHGVHFDIKKNPCFPKKLQKAGYKTCAAGKWQIDDFRLKPNAMNDAGFDKYCMWTGAEIGNVEISQERYWNPYIYSEGKNSVLKGKFGPDVYSDYVLNFLSENKEHPMFVYYAMTLPHTPFVHTPLEPNAKTKYEKHCAMVRYLDMLIGKLVNKIDELDIADNTYVFFTTDNGTVLSIKGKREGRDVRGGKTLLSNNGINAPFFVLTPNKALRGKKVDALVDFTDIHPTVLDLAQAKYNSKQLNGTSFANLLRGTSNETKEIALSMGGLPAHIDQNGKVKNYALFRDRAIMTNKYKVFLTKQRTIDRIYRIEDIFEDENLVDNIEIKQKVENILKNYIAELPELDNNPKYKKIENTTYNEDVNKLKSNAEKVHSRKSNFAR